MRCLSRVSRSVNMPEHTVKALPLHGRRILVTRASEQAEAFSERLRVLGAIPVEFATIRIVPPEDWEPLDDALRRLCGAGWYDWLVFISVDGVRTCFERLRSLGYDAPTIGGVRTAAIRPPAASAPGPSRIPRDLQAGAF